MNFTPRQLLDRKVVCTQLNFLAIVTNFVRACNRLCWKYLWIKLSLRRLLGTRWAVWKWSGRLLHWVYVQFVAQITSTRTAWSRRASSWRCGSVKSLKRTWRHIDLLLRKTNRERTSERAVAVDLPSFGGSCRWVNLQVISSWAHHKRTSYDTSRGDGQSRWILNRIFFFVMGIECVKTQVVIKPSVGYYRHVDSSWENVERRHWHWWGKRKAKGRKKKVEHSTRISAPPSQFVFDFPKFSFSLKFHDDETCRNQQTTSSTLLISLCYF